MCRWDAYERRRRIEREFEVIYSDRLTRLDGLPEEAEQKIGVIATQAPLLSTSV